MPFAMQAFDSSLPGEGNLEINICMLAKGDFVHIFSRAGATGRHKKKHGMLKESMAPTFCTNEMSDPGGTSAPLMLAFVTKLSFAKVKAVCVYPALRHQVGVRDGQIS
jgi:hypothetical protein